MTAFPSEAHVCVVEWRGHPVAEGFVYGFGHPVEFLWAASDNTSPSMLPTCSYTARCWSSPTAKDSRSLILADRQWIVGHTDSNNKGVLTLASYTGITGWPEGGVCRS
jgi:hypothetical protein